jgi:hypothetical protein
MTTGFIKIHRKICKWEWYQDANTFRLFVHLLLNANHKKLKWQGNEIDRGQLITGLNSLSNDLGLSVQQIRTSISKLKSTSEITVNPTNKFSLITLINYDSYQSKEVFETGKPTSQPTDEQQTGNNQSTTNNNGNNNKNVKNKELPKILVEQKPDDSEFDRFWEIYDKNVNRDKCRPKFRKLNKSDVAKIFETLPAYVDATPEKQFRKAPLVYLNNSCWNDEIINTSNGSGFNGQKAQSSFVEFPS